MSVLSSPRNSNKAKALKRDAKPPAMDLSLLSFPEIANNGEYWAEEFGPPSIEELPDLEQEAAESSLNLGAESPRSLQYEELAFLESPLLSSGSSSGSDSSSSPDSSPSEPTRKRNSRSSSSRHGRKLSTERHCGICFEPANQPSKTSCCGKIFCFKHISDSSSCPSCGAAFSIVSSSTPKAPSYIPSHLPFSQAPARIARPYTPNAIPDPNADPMPSPMPPCTPKTARPSLTNEEQGVVLPKIVAPSPMRARIGRPSLLLDVDVEGGSSSEVSSATSTSTPLSTATSNSESVSPVTACTSGVGLGSGSSLSLPSFGNMSSAVRMRGSGSSYPASSSLLSFPSSISRSSSSSTTPTPRHLTPSQTPSSFNSFTPNPSRPTTPVSAQVHLLMQAGQSPGYADVELMSKVMGKLCSILGFVVVLYVLFGNGGRSAGVMSH